MSLLTKDEIVARVKADELFGRASLERELLERFGGEWLGSIRNWIQWNARNGSDVTWGSDQFVRLKELTVRELEELAARIAVATLSEFKNNLAKQLEIRALAIYTDPDNWEGLEFKPDFEHLHFTIAWKQKQFTNGALLGLWYQEIVSIY